MKTFMEKHDLHAADLVIGGILAACLFMSIGAHISRNETTERIFREATFDVRANGDILIEYNGEAFVR